MQWHVVCLAIGFSVLLPSAARPQTAAQLQELKRQVDALEKQLLVKGGDPNHQRITEIGGSRVHLTERPVVDDVLGGLLALGVAVLTVGAFIIILDSCYSGTEAFGELFFENLGYSIRSFEYSGPQRGVTPRA